MFEGLELEHAVFGIWRLQASEYVAYVGDFGGWWDEDDMMTGLYINSEIYTYSSSIIIKEAERTFYDLLCTVEKSKISKNIFSEKARSLYKLKSSTLSVESILSDDYDLETILGILVSLPEEQIAAIIDNYGKLKI